MAYAKITPLGHSHLINSLRSRRNAMRGRRFPGFMVTERVARSICFEKRAIDGEGRLHAFCCCRDDELYATAGIARGINAWNVGSGVFAALNAIVILAKFAAELFREMRSLILPW